jgi:hypothetical protein
MDTVIPCRHTFSLLAMVHRKKYVPYRVATLYMRVHAGDIIFRNQMCQTGLDGLYVQKCLRKS